MIVYHEFRDKMNTNKMTELPKTPPMRVISIRLRKSKLVEIDEIASVEGYRRSDIIRDFLEESLRCYGGEDKKFLPSFIRR